MADFDDDPFKRFWRRRNPFFDVFAEFDRMDSMMDEMMKKAFEDLEKSKGKPYVYGFSVKIGPEGKPVVQEFGNIEPSEKKLKVKELREPLVDVIKHDATIDVLAELPGVEKSEIDVKAADDTLSIDVKGKFHKTVKLPERVREDSVRAAYRNGVLTVTLQKLKPSKPEKKVKVE